MSTNNCWKFSLLFAILFFSFFVTAQKPAVVTSLTMGLPSPVETISRGDKKIEASSGILLQAYQTNYQVGDASPEAMAREYLAVASTELGLTPERIGDLKLSFVRESPAGTRVRLKQYHQGIPVYGAEVALTVLPNHEIAMVNNAFCRQELPAIINPGLSATEARQSAFQYLEVGGAPYEEDQELMILPLGTQARLAYRVFIGCHVPLGQWQVFVDARTGDILQAEDIAIYHREKPTEIPFPFQVQVTGTGIVFNPDPLSTSGSTYGDPGYVDNNDTNSPQLISQQQEVELRDVTFDGTQYLLKGPWAEITDEESPFRGTFPRMESPKWLENRDGNSFEAVNVYYHIDASMRYLNETLNVSVRPTLYPGGVKVDPSGLNNSDNSHYVRSSQRLAFGDGGVDDAEDVDVILHELGHGLHDWITGGGISQVQGLSEGCGDYWAASYKRFLGLWSPTEDAYYHVFGWDGHNPFWPGRRVDLSGTYPASLSGGIHNQGQFWSSSMMLIWDAIGREKTDRIFWEGIAMTGGSASQNDAAVGVFMAANALGYSLTDRQTVHTILTDRGYQLPAFNVLPVEWASVEATPRDKTIVVSWSTVAETDNAFFELERVNPSNGEFEVLGRVSPNAQRNYLWEDTSPQIGVNTYRIRQVDYDGTFSFSQLVNATINSATEKEWILSPNPADNELTLQFTGQKKGGHFLRILDLQGREFLRAKIPNTGTTISVTDLPSGVYVLQTEVGSRRFVKQ